MNDKAFNYAMLIIHINEALKYMENIDTNFPIDKSTKLTKAVADQFDQTLRRLKLFKGLLAGSSEEEKELIDNIASCYSGIGRKLLDAYPSERERLLVEVSEFYDSL